MRLFVAINLPDSEKRQLGGVLSELRQTWPSIRWVEPDSLHITVKFLGSVTDTQRRALTGALKHAAAASRPFDLDLSGFGAFPTKTRPGILWVGSSAPASLMRLHDETETALEPLGFPREARPFHPHVTIGRVKKQAEPLDAGGLDRMLASLVYNSVIRVESLDLMRSHTDSRGVRYERIERHGLSA